MSEATSQALLRAFELIEADRHDEARELLSPILDSEPENTDALWIYAHAVDTPEEALESMSLLMEIDPEYPGASELNAKVRNELGLLAPEDDFYDEFEAPDKARSGRRWLRLVAVVLIAVLLLVVVLVLTSDSDDDVPQTLEPTQVAGVQSASTNTPIPVAPTGDETEELGTEEPTEAVTPEPSEGTEEVQQVDLDDIILAAFGDFMLPDNPIETLEHSVLGETLLVSVCNGDSPLELIDRSMTLMASLSPQIVSHDTFGIRILDCETDEVINTIVVEHEVADDFQNGDIDLAEFQASWRALG